MKKFCEVLNELMLSKNLNPPKLAKELELKRDTTIYSWKNGARLPRLSSAIQLADYFNCSLAYLFGKVEIDEHKKFKKCPPFAEQLKKILKENNISQNKLMRDLNFSGGHIYSWFKLNANPQIETIIKIADYLGVSLDYLVGREN